MRKYTLLSVFVGLLTSAQAQVEIGVETNSEPVPLNDQVLTGQLENGLKYFILPNQKPENKAELRLVVNAGSVLESDQQQGLAHFCEHMAFNGTEHFQKNQLVDYLQKAGVKFGAHLNAYTSFDETVYMLSLPSNDKDLLDTGFLVLEDWASNLLFDPEEIDKERGVVLEEYRLGLGAQKRMMDQYLPILFKESRYGTRLPIGKKDVLEGFEHLTLRDFYKDWYRPNLMAVVVVGDVDPEQIEEKIKSHFSGLLNPSDEKPREEFEVPDHGGFDVSISTDPEATYNSLQIMVKQSGKREIKGSIEEFDKAVRFNLIFDMLNARLSELAQKKDAPVSYAWMDVGEMWVRTKTALNMGAIVSANKYIEAIELLVKEMKRAKTHGFSASEIQRAKVEMINNAERAVKEMDKTESRRHAGGLVEHFLSNRPMPNADWRFMRTTEVLEQLVAEQLNELLRGLNTSDGGIVILTGPEADLEKMPDHGSILATVNGANQGAIDPWEDAVVASELMSAPKSKGSLTEMSISPEVNANVFTLDNGAKIIYKQTDLKNDQILFKATSKGGKSQYATKDYLTIQHGMGAMAEGGVGDHTKMALSKILAGKTVSLRPGISGSQEYLNGNCSPENLEELLQLVHLYFSSPRSDEEAYTTYVQRQRTFLDNMLLNPNSYFNDQWSKFMYPDNDRRWTIPTDESWENTSYKRVMEVFADRFNSPSEFTFVFVGNIDPQALTDLCLTYLGSLKSSNRTEEYKDLGIRPRSGTDRLNVYKGSEPKSQVRIVYTGETTYSASDDLHLEMLGELLTIKLTETLREEMSGVYGSGARGGMSIVPYNRFSFSISFPCGPENVDALIEATLEQVQNLVENGPTEVDLDKVKQAKLKEIETNEQRNRYWLNMINSVVTNSISYSDAITTQEEINDVSTEDLRTIAEKYVSGDHLIGVLYPESEKEED